MVNVLPWPGRLWDVVADADPGTHSIRFPAVYRGIKLLCTATASGDQVTLEPLAGVKLEIPLQAWMQVTPHLTALALSTHDPDVPPAAA